jgi:hypothetical protein
LDSGSVELVEESEAVVVAEPVVPDIEGSLVYLDKELPATRETSADIGLGDVMNPGGDAGGGTAGLANFSLQGRLGASRQIC